ncbi:MAG: MFS transporter [Desulfuromonadales bacterium]|nr:MFS transporter [Desulfuromonadales bacterium]MBN2791755.1 MFS transporter [Desulfuromonadales bacterium]
MPLYTPAFAALFLANLFLVASFATFFLFPLFVTQHGGSHQDIGIIMGSFALASAFCRPWVAEMIDRIGCKRSYTIGSLIMALLPLCYLLLAGKLSDFYLPLLALRLVHGVGLAICFTAIFTFIIDLIPVKRLNEGIGIFGTSGLTGLALGPLITEPILVNFGFPAFFLAASAMAATAFLLHLPIREKRQQEPPSSVAATPSFFSLLKTRKQLVSGGMALLFGVGLAASGNFIAPYAHDKGLDYISLYYLAYSCAAVGIRFISGRMADRVGENQIIPWGLGIAAAALLLVPLIQGKPLLLITGFIFGLGHGLLFPSLNAMAIRDEPYAIRGKVTGIFTGGIDSGSFLGALILGAIGQYAGFTVLFLFAGLVMLSGLLLFRLRPV